MPGIVRTKIKNDKRVKKVYPVYVRYIISALKGLLITLGGLIVLSFLLYKGQSFTFFTKAASYLLVGTGAFVSGFFSYKKVRGRGFINGITGGAVFLLMLLLPMLIILKFNFSFNVIYMVVLCVLCGFIGGTVGANS